MTRQGRSPIRRPIGGPSLADGKEGSLRLPRDPLRVAIFLIIVMAVSRIHQHFGFIGVFRPAQILVAASVVYAVANQNALGKIGAIKTWPARAIALIALLACLSAAFGISLGRAASYILDNYSKVVAVAFLIILSVRGTRDLILYTWGFVLGCGLLAYLALFEFDLSLDSGTMRLNNLYTYDANEAGSILVIGIPLTLLAFHTSRGKARLLSAVILFASAQALARTGSRGAFVGAVIVAIALLLLTRSVSLSKRVGAILVLALGVTISAPSGYWDRMRSLSDPTEDYNWTAEDGRKAVAERGIGYMLSYPIFGVGIDNFAMAEGTISSKAEENIPGTGLRWTAAHNSHIQVAAELGVTGLLLWISFLGGTMCQLLRLRRAIPDVWRRGTAQQRFLFNAPAHLTVALTAFIVTSTFVSFAWVDPVYFLTAFSAAMLAIGRATVAENDRVPVPARRSRVRRVAAL